jgi:hypothetical protein
MDSSEGLMLSHSAAAESMNILHSHILLDKMHYQT